MLFVVEVELETNIHQYNPDAPEMEPCSDVFIRGELKRHIQEAVESWGGQLWPGHLLFSQNFKKVKVSAI
jgi:hypothetical protein